jgi:hypothetical protein
MRAFARLRSKLAALERRVRVFFAGAGGRGVAARWILAILLFLVAVAFLVFLSWLLRGAGLWGDLAFAILVTTGVFWIARRLAEPLLHEGPIRALPRAFAATVFVLIGIPVAYVTRPVGFVLLLLPIALYASVRIARWRWGRPGWRPVFWQAEVAGVALLGIVLLVAPSVATTDRVPKAVPAASTERGELDAAVAERFRPLLFFDSGEQRFPLDIQDAIAGGRVEMCRKAVRDDLCEQVALAEEIDENLDYLELSEAPGTPRGGGDGSAYYYHVVREGDRVYVDYWWFYSRNPSPVAEKVFCGPGLRLPPFTCQEHSGDWEGLTVVLAPCDAGAEDCEDVEGELLGPEEIRYGQHEHVVAYDWDEALSRFWGSLGAPTEAVLAEAWTELVLPAVEDAGARPVAFVARNSHASYPAPCFRNCRQETRDLPEARHDGTVPWAHNAECDGCVKPLPLTAEGEPALWNAFPGRWGQQECILGGAYCDLSGAPRGPSFQRRYQDPAGEVEEVCLVAGRRLEHC